MAEIEKKKHKLKATFSMGEKLYEMYADMRYTLIDCEARVLSEDSDAILPFIAALRTFYGEIRFLIIDTPKFNRYLEEIKKLKNEWDIKRRNNPSAFPDSLVDVLVNMKDDLVEVAQLSGIGIDVKKDINIDKLKKMHLEGKE